MSVALLFAGINGLTMFMIAKASCAPYGHLVSVISRIKAPLLAKLSVPFPVS
jgi:hypothetical protein